VEPGAQPYVRSFMARYFTSIDWPHDDWGDDCPPPYPKRWHSMAALPSPQVVVPNSPPCAPRFGLSTDWGGNTCAKLHETVGQVVSPGPAPPVRQDGSAKPQAGLLPCGLNLGINRNWLDSNCAKLHEGTVQANAAPTTPAQTAPPCVLNLGVNRDWLDGNCARLLKNDNVPQAGQDAGTKSSRDIFSSIVAPIDLHAYRASLANWTLDVILIVAAVFIVLLCARLVGWASNRQPDRTERRVSDGLSPLTSQYFAEPAPRRSDPSDRRPQQAQELADRAKELQIALFGQP
jgi:hypothetical protein